MFRDVSPLGTVVFISKLLHGAPHAVTMVENLSASAEDARDLGSIPGSGRFPGEGHGNPLQYSCLENPMD